MKISKKSIYKLLGFFIMILFSLTSCEKPQSRKDNDREYENAVREWHRYHIKSLTEPDSWLSLAGLYWLKEGENRFGSAATNDIVFPQGKAPDFIGVFILESGRVRVVINKGIHVRSNNSIVTETVMQNDATGLPTELELGSLSWHIIKRADKFGVRLRDSEHPRLKAFKGIETYPIDPQWSVTARFEPYDPPRKITMPTVLGTVNEENCPGALVFEVGGKTCRLDPIADPEDESFFIIFADETSGGETYGGGRFLGVNRPGKDGTTVIDFNLAYNPPCAFSEFATCPLPPAQNRLGVRITAGEKKYEDGGH